ELRERLRRQRLDFRLLADIGDDRQRLDPEILRLARNGVRSCSFERALTTTCAPSPASFNTVARPMLRPEPVTSATLPSSLPIRPSHDPVRQVEGNPM